MPGLVDKRLGALPVVAGFLRRLDVAGIVDRACPVRETARSTHGQVIEALIANRLTSPAPLQHVSDWAREWAVEEVFGLSPDVLNDDRLARALDAIAPQLEQITGSAGARAIGVFGLDAARLHWDMTSMSLYGAYEETADGFPAPAWGHPKDRRTDLKQIQAGLAVTADGGVPVFHRAYDGGAAEVSQVTAAMASLAAMAGQRDFLLIGDSKLISWKNAGAMIDAGTGFIAPLAASRVPAGLFASLSLAGARPVDYTAQRDAGKPAGQRCAYRVLEDTMDLAGPRKHDRVLRLRRILVHSTASAEAAANARALKLRHAAAELDKLARGAGGRYYRDAAAITAKLSQITARRKVTAYLRTAVTTDPRTGKPSLAWHFDTEAINTEAAADGWSALLTSLSPQQAGAAEILTRYKGQPAVERRYSDFKGPSQSPPCSCTATNASPP